MQTHCHQVEVSLTKSHGHQLTKSCCGKSGKEDESQYILQHFYISHRKKNVQEIPQYLTNKIIKFSNHSELTNQRTSLKSMPVALSLLLKNLRDINSVLMAIIHDNIALGRYTENDLDVKYQCFFLPQSFIKFSIY